MAKMSRTYETSCIAGDNFEIWNIFVLLSLSCRNIMKNHKLHFNLRCRKKEYCARKGFMFRRCANISQDSNFQNGLPSATPFTLSIVSGIQTKIVKITKGNRRFSYGYAFWFPVAECKKKEVYTMWRSVPEL